MQNNNTAQYWKMNLGLKAHPEGGHFREVYRSGSVIPKSSLPDTFDGDRNYSTSIYFLLEEVGFSAFHRLRSDETWYFHAGDAVVIYVINPEGILSHLKLGLDLDEKCLPQLTIPKNHWFAAKCLGAYTLMGCNVAPGFNFADFELAERDLLLSHYPQHKEIILRFTSA